MQKRIISKKENRGGAGRNQGRHQEFKEPTVRVSFRFPVSKRVEITNKVVEVLNEYKNGVKTAINV